MKLCLILSCVFIKNAFYLIAEMAHNSADYLHITCEAFKLSVSDGQWYCADPAVFPNPTEDLISKVYAARQTNRLNLQR